jgi:hypothetical protein
MIGTHPPQKGLFSYHINLDQHVRPDHPLRQINQVVDFGFVRAEVAFPLRLQRQRGRAARNHSEDDVPIVLR